MYFYGEDPNWNYVLLGMLVESNKYGWSRVTMVAYLDIGTMTIESVPHPLIYTRFV